MSPEAVIHVIRHARAGSRSGWDGDDELRPLSGRGRRQAHAIAGALAGAGVDELLSSRYLRCVQTLAPLGVVLGREVAVVDELTEGASGAAALDRLLASVAAGRTPAASSHGDVIPALIATALGRGAELHGPASPAKGARYVLAVRDGRVTRIDHVPAPDGDRA